MFGRKALQLEIADLERQITDLEQVRSTQEKALKGAADERAALGKAASAEKAELQEAWEAQYQDLKEAHGVELVGLTANHEAQITKLRAEHEDQMATRTAERSNERQLHTHQIEGYRVACENWRAQCEALHHEKVLAMHRVAWEWCPDTDTFSIPSLDLVASLNGRTKKWDLLDATDADTIAKSADYEVVALVAKFRRTERLKAALGEIDLDGTE